VLFLVEGGSATIGTKTRICRKFCGSLKMDNNGGSLKWTTMVVHEPNERLFFMVLIPLGKPKSNDNGESIKEIEKKRNGGMEVRVSRGSAM
jgi:hypothetical protein